MSFSRGIYASSMKIVYLYISETIDMHCTNGFSGRENP